MVGLERGERNVAKKDSLRRLKRLMLHGLDVEQRNDSLRTPGREL